MGKLDGRVAAITGGTAGIGRAIAEAFLEEGATVSLNGRSAEKGEKVLAELGVGSRASFQAGDVTEAPNVEAFIDGAIARHGKIDILVNNAGGGSVLVPTIDMPYEAWDHTIKWNLYSTFWASKRALPSMLAQSWGRIINISSVEGKHGKPVLGPYVAAKHAIIGLTKTIAQEVGTQGVTCNSICPGLVITDIVNENGPSTAAAMGMTFEEMVALYSSEAATKRPTTAEEVAAVAVLLASELGGGITGSSISVDGGTSAY